MFKLGGAGLGLGIFMSSLHSLAQEKASPEKARNAQAYISLIPFKTFV